MGYKPGVTDPVGKSALVAVEDTLGRSLADGEGAGQAAVYTSRLYLLSGVDAEGAQRIARELLANPVIHTIDVQARDEWLASDPDLSIPRVAARGVPEAERIDLSGDDARLMGISRERLLALTLP